MNTKGIYWILAMSFEVTILRCSNKSYWYQKHIGETYEVETFDDLSKYKVKGDNRTIDLLDVLSDDEYHDHKVLKDYDFDSKEFYEELRAFLDKNDASADLVQKLFLLYRDASFFD
jgi:hypothetical protein